jgi:glycerol-3-phosphate dehydrogenase
VGASTSTFIVVQGENMKQSFSLEDRNRGLSKMAGGEFDLLVIGGGINGAGVARDAASRGMKVALVEASDFASGTSSRSSKLIHGGIRYLENFEFHLVFEALSERTLLFAMAPHLVHPLRFVLPLYEDSRVGMFKMGLGMMLYDVLSSFDAPENHERLNAKRSLERVPLLQANGLAGSYVYSDAYMDDDRLVIETLRDAQRKGALCANYASMIEPLWEGERVCGARVRDEMSGQIIEVKARHIICTLGPWTDIFGKKILKEWQPIMRPSKGTHITLDRRRLPLQDAIVMAAEKGDRIVFAIPRHDMIILGTTDTDYLGDPRDVHADAQDVEYLLEVAERYFPGAKLTRQDILATYAGVRPLVNDGSKTESKVSREHTIFTDPRNITFVVGGKYTTYRRMAEQTVEKALESFGLEDRVRFGLNDTRTPLNPDVDMDLYQRSLRQVTRWSQEFGIEINFVQALVERLGPEAEASLATLKNYYLISQDCELAYWQTLASHAIENTMCCHIVDFYLRRTPLFLGQRDHGARFLRGVLEVFRKHLHWSEDQEVQEQKAWEKMVAKETW